MKQILAPQTRQFIVNIVVLAIAAVLFWLAYILRNIFIVFLFSCFFAILLSPFVAKLKQWKCPDILSIFSVFFLVIISVILFLSSLVPVFIEVAENSKAYVVRSITVLEQQAQQGFPFINNLPFGAGDLLRKNIDVEYFSQLLVSENRTQIVTQDIVGNIDTIKRFFGQGAGYVSSIGLSFASGISSIIATSFVFILFTFFILLERRIFLNWFFAFLPSELGNYFRSRQHIITQATHTWLRGQLTLAICMFVINFVGLYIAQLFGLPIKHIFSLSLVAGVAEFIPYLGPIITFVLAFLMVLVSPEMTPLALLGVTVLYIIFQQIEGNFLYTYIMSQTLRLPGLYVFMVTLIGATLGGGIGVVLAMPLAAIIHIFYHDWMHYRRVMQKEEKTIREK